jgi:hypothetical protein
VDISKKSLLVVVLLSLGSFVYGRAEETGKAEKNSTDVSEKQSADAANVPALAAKRVEASVKPASEPPCPRPADFLARNQADEYIEQAQAYLKNHTTRNDAPMVAHDLMMVATAERKKDLADKMKERLLLEYPQSFYTYYLLLTMSNDSGPGPSNGGAECARLLKEIIAKADDPFSAEFNDKLVKTMQRCWAHFGERLLNDDELLLNLALLMRVGGQEEAARWHKDKLLKKEDKCRKIAEIALGDWSDKASILLKLHDLKKPELTDLYRRYFLSQLTPEQKRSPEMQKVAIADLLEQQEFEKALGLLEEPSSKIADPQLLYWRAWCRHTQGDAPGAMRDLAQIEEKYPESPWKPLAGQMADRIKGWDANLDQYAQGILDALSKIRAEGIEMLETTMRYQKEDGKAIDFYLSLAPRDGLLEVVISQSGKMTFGYATHAHDSKLYFDGEAAIHEFAQSGFYPDFKYQINRDPDGKYGFNFNANTSESPAALAGLAKPLQDSELFKTKADILELVKPALKGGWQPAQASNAAGEKVYRWVRPKIDQPTEECWQYAIAQSGEIRRVAGESVQCNSLRYGRQGSFQFSPPSWPDLPLARHEKMEATTMFRMLGAVASLFTTPDKTQVADKPTPTKR